MRLPLAFAALSLLAACGHRDDDVGGVTPDEQRQLNEAAETLNANYMAPVDNQFVVNDTTTAETNATGNAQ